MLLLRKLKKSSAKLNPIALSLNNCTMNNLKKIIISLVLFIGGEFISFIDSVGNFWYIKTVLFLSAYVIVGFQPIRTAVQNISRGQIFDENFLMTVATLGAICLKQWDEAVAVMLFYAIGSYFEDYAVNKSRKSISSLMSIYPEYANLITDDGEKVVDPYDLNVGDHILVKPGERIPVDGIIINGSASIDSSAITGESMPLDVDCGMSIASGCINIDGVLTVEVTHAFEDSTVTKILDMVENSGAKKANVEKFITKFARYYTPIVVFLAVALAILPPIIFQQEFSKWAYRAMLFLVISCPCALVISVPLAFFGGVGAAGKIGVLVKGSNFIELLSKTKTFITDKTGTLTTGNFKVTEISSPDVLELIAVAEVHSSHPISLSIKEAYMNGSGKTPDESRVSDIKEIPGRGLTAKIDEETYYIGNAKLMKEIGVFEYRSIQGKTAVHISKGDEYCGFVALEDTIKEEAKTTLSIMQKSRQNRFILLTGDNNSAAEKVCERLGIKEYYAELLPQDKVEILERILDKENSPVSFVGDGINDAPSLARADIGIAMGGLGSQAAIEAADVVIMNDSLAKIPAVIDISKRTMKVAHQNVIFALSIKALILILGTVGLANMWMAVFADVGVSIIAILNSMRMLLQNKKSRNFEH